MSNSSFSSGFPDVLFLQFNKSQHFWINVETQQQLHCPPKWPFLTFTNCITSGAKGWPFNNAISASLDLLLKVVGKKCSKNIPTKWGVVSLMVIFIPSISLPTKQTTSFKTTIYISSGSHTKTEIQWKGNVLQKPNFRWDLVMVVDMSFGRPDFFLKEKRTTKKVEKTHQQFTISIFNQFLGLDSCKNFKNNSVWRDILSRQFFQ